MTKPRHQDTVNAFNDFIDNFDHEAWARAELEKGDREVKAREKREKKG